MATEAATTILYILCPSQSGSTLLSLLLGNQPDLYCAGELDIFTQSRDKAGRLPQRRCSCGQLPWQRCDFWSAVDGALQDRYQVSLAELDVEAEEEAIFHKHNQWLYDTIRLISGKNIIVDSSKLIVRFSRLQKAGFNVIPIRLQRKPPAVIYSWVNRGEHWKPADRGHKWWNVAEYYTTFYKTLNKVVPAKSLIKVDYDQLSQHSDTTIESLLNQLEIAPKDVQLDWSKEQHHHLSGNPMRYKAQTTITKDNRWHDGFTLKEKLSIYFITLPTLLDQRWLYMLWKYPIRAFLRIREFLIFAFERK